jgi:hypothetical protein
MIFGMQKFHEDMQVNFEYGCCPIIIWGVIALGIRKRFENKLLPLDLENVFKMTVSVHFLDDSLMNSNFIWYTDVSWRDAGFFFYFHFLFFKGEGVAFSYIFNFLRTAEMISMILGTNEVLMIPYKCCCISK